MKVKNFSISFHKKYKKEGHNVGNLQETQEKERIEQKEKLEKNRLWKSANAYKVL